MTAYETIIVETEGRVGVITLNRPKALNALNTQLMNEVVSAAKLSISIRGSAPLC